MSDDSAIHIWSLTKRTVQAKLYGHGGWVRSICSFTLHGRIYLASASYDRTVSTWNPETGAQIAILNGHAAGVNAVCALIINGRAFLASASNDKTLRIWDLMDDARLVVPTRDESLSLVYASEFLVVRTTAGLLTSIVQDS